MRADKIGVCAKIDFNISLWDAIKLRIAGKNYQAVLKEMLILMNTAVKEDTKDK